MAQIAVPAAAWLAVAVVAFAAVFLYAGAEIGLFSMSRLRLRLRTHQGEAAAVQVTLWLRHPTRPLEGLLILQNLAGFALAAAVTAILKTWHFGPLSETVLSTLIVTPLILVLGDITPKDLFHTHADRWMYRMVPFLKGSLRLITIVPILPLVHLVGWLSTLPLRRRLSAADRARQLGGSPSLPVAGAAGGPLVGPRAEILTLFEEPAETGSMSNTQQDLIQRALRMARISIREVMIPWNRVVGVPASISRDGFIAVIRHYSVSRMPVLGKNAFEVLGMIEILDVLGDLPTSATPAAPAAGAGGAAGASKFDLRRYARPAMTLIGEQSVRSAITLMQRARQTIAVVVDRQGRAVGLVTMKDLIEELVGDLETW
jgi:CBS domain containing-hemolysin-like protein